MPFLGELPMKNAFIALLSAELAALKSTNPSASSASAQSSKIVAGGGR